ncbi:MAG: hypothetical protein HDS44_00295 [Bacteroides sp.]|nr:hypothetical protein [Bacteroides sp.]
MADKDSEKVKEHIIQVPLYTIPLTEEDASSSFFPTTYEQIIELVKNRLDSFKPYELKNNKKERRTVIENLAYSEKQINSIPCILVRCAVYDSNLGDTTIEDDHIIPLSPTAKVKAANYFFLLYPKIDGPLKKRICSILMLVYDDPYHDSVNSCRIATTVTKKILKLKPINQKLDSVIHEIEKTLTIPQLQIVLSSYDATDSNYAPNINLYRVKTSNFRKQVINFESVPKHEALNVIEDDDCGDFSVKEISITMGKKQIKVRRDISKGIEAMKLSIESVFNSSAIVTEEELKRLYEEDFIIEKIKPILSNYLSNGTISPT